MIKVLPLFLLRRTVVVIVLSLCLCSGVTTPVMVLAQQPSLQRSAQDSLYVRRLEYVCKVWGYTKYFHNGMVRDMQWDEVLLRALQAVQSARSDQDYHQAIEQVLSSAGAVTTAMTAAPTLPRERFIPVDYSWMHDSTMLSASVRSRLELIRQHFRPFRNFYVGVSPVGTPQPQNENRYSGITAPDEQYRLLALFRYWNVINYFFPYKDVIGRSWDAVLREMIPVFINTPQDGGSYHLALARLSAHINDSHGFVQTPFFWQAWGSGILPVGVSFIEGQTVVTGLSYLPSFLEASGVSSLRIGDVLTHINGEHVDSIRRRLTPFTPASNSSALHRNLNTLIRYGTIGWVTLTVQRGTERFTIRAQRVAWNTENNARLPTNTPIWRILDGNIGYVDMGRLEVADVQRMMTALANTRGIVFDVRNYPRGTMDAIGSYLGTPRPFVIFTAPDPLHAGTFAVPANSWLPQPFVSELSVGGSLRYAGRTVGLMNAVTQSHAEFTCMAFRALGMPLVGSQTAGADGNVVELPMPANSTLGYTSLGVFYPSGAPTQRIGIVPDVRVEPTIAGIRAGRDEVLERGIEVMFGAASGVTSVAAASGSVSPVVSPNPANDAATVHFFVPTAASANEHVHVRLFNALGRQVRSLHHQAVQGANTVLLPTDDLPSGVYICRIDVPNVPAPASVRLSIVR